MARRTIKIGSLGPFVFDDANTFPDGDTHGLHVDRTPTEDTEVMRKVDVGAGAIAAPEDAEFIVVSLSSGLTNERRLQAGTGLTLNDGGANGDLTIQFSTPQTGYTTFSNLSTDRTLDADATTIDELADVLGTLIEDLKTKGIISA